MLMVNTLDLVFGFLWLQAGVIISVLSTVEAEHTWPGLLTSRDCKLESEALTGLLSMANALDLVYWIIMAASLSQKHTQHTELNSFCFCFSNTYPRKSVHSTIITGSGHPPKISQKTLFTDRQGFVLYNLCPIKLRGYVYESWACWLSNKYHLRSVNIVVVFLSKKRF